MTKRVRVENADTSDHVVTVQVWDVGYEGDPDTLVTELLLSYPSALTEVTIWKGRYVIIKET